LYSTILPSEYSHFSELLARPPFSRTRNSKYEEKCSMQVLCTRNVSKRGVLRVCSQFEDHPSKETARVPMTSNDSPIPLSSGDSTVGTKKNSNVAPVLSSIANNPIAPGDSSVKSTENPNYFSMLSDPITENIPTAKLDIPSEPCAENGGNERMDLCLPVENIVCILSSSRTEKST
ncbi:hypothetical protein V2J09_010642, partial [Rumex salicifolius]